MPLVFEMAVLAAAGLVAGALNIVAGGGSFLTLPLLLFLGMPPAVANATNRVGLLAQNISGVWGFHRHGALDWHMALVASVPAVAGAGLGAWLSLRVPGFAFTRILSLAMLGITLWTLRGGSSRGGADEGSTRGSSRHASAWGAAGFFLVGVYGGFIQAGVGFFILALTTWLGLDLVRGNAVKVFGVLMMTVLSLLIFSAAGTVDWARGAALGLGNFAGGIAGVRIAVLRGHRWLERVVTGVIFVFAILLWLT